MGIINEINVRQSAIILECCVLCVHIGLKTVFQINFFIFSTCFLYNMCVTPKKIKYIHIYLIIYGIEDDIAHPPHPPTSVCVGAGPPHPARCLFIVRFLYLLEVCVRRVLRMRVLDLVLPII